MNDAAIIITKDAKDSATDTVKIVSKDSTISVKITTLDK